MDTLICTHCPKSCGTLVETSIALDACQAFGNNGGELVCDAPSNADNIPAGSYQDSCGGCSLDGATLTCTHCATGGNPLHAESSIASDSCQEGEHIGNANGVLQCESQSAGDGGRRLAEEVPNAEGIPEGSFASSCGGCTVDSNVGSATEGVLTCSHCNTGGGTADNDYADTIASSILISECGEGQQIGNQLRRLLCEPVASPDKTCAATGTCESSDAAASEVADPEAEASREEL